MSINLHDIEEGVVVNHSDATSGCSRQAKSAAEAVTLYGPVMLKSRTCGRMVMPALSPYSVSASV